MWAFLGEFEQERIVKQVSFKLLRLIKVLVLANIWKAFTTNGKLRPSCCSLHFFCQTFFYLLLFSRKVLDVSIQTLEALECLHSYQYIHRDIKPGNFVYGLGDDEALIYIIDFGMTTKYCHTASRMPPTSIYDFIGTLRYASRTTHQGNAQTRRDDLESWLFVIMEIYDRSSLPWKKEQDKKIVLDMKEAFFSEDGKL